MILLANDGGGSFTGQPSELEPPARFRLRPELAAAARFRLLLAWCGGSSTGAAATGAAATPTPTGLADRRNGDLQQTG